MSAPFGDLGPTRSQIIGRLFVATVIGALALLTVAAVTAVGANGLGEGVDTSTALELAFTLAGPSLLGVALGAAAMRMRAAGTIGSCESPCSHSQGSRHPPRAATA
ncbi:hypothetical protein EKO23_04430 [Nocardioides guangzhouensis]|uniref:Uncharacterized protein n=1 Tax=Nocardioides guangzhouensis TaxID=2497878 RepID=A0A4Q4ZIP7_9ACTN|nr:hypothetical protein [Nocardioides guangzhouensis]RYP88093.1 hypothetical protein EKO23_04430 [Nocardioides guangzhouensis]